MLGAAHSEEPLHASTWATPGAREAVRVGAVLAAILAVAVYAGAFRYGFVSDDVPFLATARTAGGVTDWRHFFLQPGVPDRGDHPTYRPLALWTYAAVDAFGGTGPLGHHLANVLLHAAAAAVLVPTLAATGIPPLAAAAGGVLFAVHPVHTEAVTHVGGRGDVLVGLFAFVALLGWMRALRVPRAGAAVASAVVSMGASACALASGEQALALIALLPLAHLVLRLEGRSGTVAGRIVLYGGLAGVALGYVALRRTVLASAPASDPTALFQGNPAALLPFRIRALTDLALVRTMLSVLLVPVRLSASYAFRAVEPAESFVSPGVAVGLALTLVVAGAGVVLAFRSRAAFFWLLLVVLGVVAVANLAFVTGTIFREGAMYLPSAGVCGVAAWLLVAPHGARRMVGTAAAGAAAVTLGALTIVRNPVWRDGLSLAEATVRTAPASAQAQRMLASAHADAGRDSDALAEYQQALAIYPGDKVSLYNIGVLLQRGDKPIEALSVFRRLADADPKFAPAWINIAAINNGQGAFAPALDAAGKAIAARPDIPNGYVVRGLALRGLRKFPEARDAFGQALRLAPRQPEALLGLGATATDLGDWDLGIDAFRRLIDVAPVRDAYRGLVFCLREAGHVAEANDLARTAHEKFPDDPFFLPEGPEPPPAS